MDDQQWGTRVPPEQRSRAPLPAPSTKLVERRLEAIAARLGRDVMTLPIPTLQDICTKFHNESKANADVDEEAYIFAVDRHNDYALAIELRQRIEHLAVPTA
jgi:hypothetical protein